LGSMVRGDRVRKAKTRDPGGTKGLGTDSGRGGRKRNGFSPPSSSVHNGVDMGVALGGRKGTYEVNVNVGKTTGRNRNGGRRWGDMGVGFGRLTRNTLSGPEVDIPCHALPEKTGSD
jgi:hypothetical protein